MCGRESMEPNALCCTRLLTNAASLELDAGERTWKHQEGFSTGSSDPVSREISLDASGEKSSGLVLQFSLCTERSIWVL